MKLVIISIIIFIVIAAIVLLVKMCAVAEEISRHDESWK
jgi:membrane protein CcdC involved in cytochrome C biogenesis